MDRVQKTTQIRGDVRNLVREMETSIAEANAFIEQMQTGKTDVEKKPKETASCQ